LDDIELKDVADFENKVLQKCKSDKPEIMESIAKTGKIEEDIEKQLVELIKGIK
jgi:F0F1-type ATP synthase, alpha subunit